MNKQDYVSWKERKIKELGSEEAFIIWRNSKSSKGGKNSPRTGGFDKNPELAKKASRIRWDKKSKV